MNLRRGLARGALLILTCPTPARPARAQPAQGLTTNEQQAVSRA